MALVNRPSGFLNAIYTVSQALSLAQVSSESPATNNYSDVLAEEMRGKKRYTRGRLFSSLHRVASVQTLGVGTVLCTQSVSKPALSWREGESFL